MKGVRRRCSWCGEDPLMIEYHDKEWGIPVHDDRHFFELLVLEGAQAGLSWRTILNKREGYRRAFRNFDPKKVAAFGPSERLRLLTDAAIVRNRAKIASAITNAASFLKVQREFGSFDAYVWRFVDNKQVRKYPRSSKNIPAISTESDALSADLRARGFSFVGSTICYAFLQAAGLVNDHTSKCYRCPSRKKR